MSAVFMVKPVTLLCLAVATLACSPKPPLPPPRPSGLVRPGATALTADEGVFASPTNPLRQLTPRTPTTGGAAWSGGADRLSESDRLDILRLAAALGVEMVGRVSVGLTSCTSIVVESRVLKTDSLLTWRRLPLRELDRGRCRARRGEITSRLGRWGGNASDLQSVSGWRVVDGFGNTDVEVGPTVSYDETRRIVQAVRQGTLVDRQDPRPPTNDPDLAKGTVERITRDEFLGATHRASISRPGGWGHTLYVRVLDDAIELVGIGLVMPDID